LIERDNSPISISNSYALIDIVVIASRDAWRRSDFAKRSKG
jgi:hypothetical protein